MYCILIKPQGLLFCCNLGSKGVVCEHHGQLFVIQQLLPICEISEKSKFLKLPICDTFVSVCRLGSQNAIDQCSLRATVIPFKNRAEGQYIRKVCGPCPHPYMTHISPTYSYICSYTCTLLFKMPSKAVTSCTFIYLRVSDS